MGETEEQMVSFMQRLWRMGVMSHLFSFLAEKGSQLGDRPQPPWPTYLRVQLARYLIEENLSSQEKMGFDERGHVIDFGLDRDRIMEIVNLGTPFMTTGCLGSDGQVACNRPFGNCLPDDKQWNYPILPTRKNLPSFGNIFSRSSERPKYKMSHTLFPRVFSLSCFRGSPFALSLIDPSDLFVFLLFRAFVVVFFP